MSTKTSCEPGAKTPFGSDHHTSPKETVAGLTHRSLEEISNLNSYLISICKNTLRKVGDQANPRAKITPNKDRMSARDIQQPGTKAPCGSDDPPPQVGVAGLNHVPLKVNSLNSSTLSTGEDTLNELVEYMTHLTGKPQYTTSNVLGKLLPLFQRKSYLQQNRHQAQLAQVQEDNQILKDGFKRMQDKLKTLQVECKALQEENKILQESCRLARRMKESVMVPGIQEEQVRTTAPTPAEEALHKGWDTEPDPWRKETDMLDDQRTYESSDDSGNSHQAVPHGLRTRQSVSASVETLQPEVQSLPKENKSLCQHRQTAKQKVLDTFELIQGATSSGYDSDCAPSPLKNQTPLLKKLNRKPSSQVSLRTKQSLVPPVNPEQKYFDCRAPPFDKTLQYIDSCHTFSHLHRFESPHGKGGDISAPSGRHYSRPSPTTCRFPHIHPERHKGDVALEGNKLPRAMKQSKRPRHRQRRRQSQGGEGLSQP